MAASEPIEPRVKTLDSIHLGSSHDAPMLAAATSLGYPAFDPAVER